MKAIHILLACLLLPGMLLAQAKRSGSRLLTDERYESGRRGAGPPRGSLANAKASGRATARKFKRLKTQSKAATDDSGYGRPGTGRKNI